MPVGKWNRRVRPRVLVVYGEHEKSWGEVFSVRVVENLFDEDLANVRFERYRGEADTSRQRWKYPDLEFRAFVRRFLPFDYTVDVHDAGYKSSKPPPAKRGHLYPDRPFFFDYISRKKPQLGLRKELFELGKEYLAGSIHASYPLYLPHDMAPRPYDATVVEFYPSNISKGQATEFLGRFLRILSKYRRRP